MEYASPSALGVDQFLSDHFHASRPAVIRGGIRDWKAIGKWGAEHFQNLYPGREFEVGCNNRAVYRRLENAQGRSVERESEKLPCEEAMRKITSSESGRSYYLQKQSIPDLFPELMEDLRIPEEIPKQRLTDVNLWFGGGGNVTPLHYDFSNNFLAQVSGVKQFTLIAPEYFQQCYPAESANLSHLSLVDLENVDAARFPEFKSVPLIHATIEPGDLLYMPPFWWHFVTLEEPSISVNFWWTSHVSQCCWPAALKRLPGAFARGVLPQAFRQLDTDGFDSLYAIANDYAERGARAAAVLIAAAGMETEAAVKDIKPAEEEMADWRLRWSKIGDSGRWPDAGFDGERASSCIQSALENGDAGVKREDVDVFIRNASGFKWRTAGSDLFEPEIRNQR